MTVFVTDVTVESRFLRSRATEASVSSVHRLDYLVACTKLDTESEEKKLSKNDY